MGPLPFWILLPHEYVLLVLSVDEMLCVALLMYVLPREQIAEKWQGRINSSEHRQRESTII